MFRKLTTILSSIIVTLIIFFVTPASASAADFTASNVQFDLNGAGPALLEFDYSGYSGGSITKIKVSEPGSKGISGVVNSPTCTGGNHCEGEIDQGVSFFPEFCDEEFYVTLYDGSDDFSQPISGSSGIVNCGTVANTFTASNVEFDLNGAGPATYDFDYSSYGGGSVSTVYVTQGNNHQWSASSSSPSCSGGTCTGTFNNGLGSFPACGDDFYLVMTSGGTNYWSQKLSTRTSMVGCSGDFRAYNVRFDLNGAGPALVEFNYSGYTGGTITKVKVSEPGSTSISGIVNSPTCSANFCQGSIDQGVGSFPEYCADNFYVTLYDGSDDFSQPISGTDGIVNCITPANTFTISNVNFNTSVSPATYSFNYSGYSGGTVNSVKVSRGNSHLLSGSDNNPTCSGGTCSGTIDDGLGSFPTCNQIFYFSMYPSSHHWSQSINGSVISGC